MYLWTIATWATSENWKEKHWIFYSEFFFQIGTWNQQVGFRFDQIKEPEVIKIEEPPEHSKLVNN
jgi:hypothetical protein